MAEQEPQIEPTLMEVASGLPEEGSLLDQLVQRRDEVSERTEVDIKLPMYSDDDISLYVRYRLIEARDLQRMARKTQVEFKKDYERNLYGSIDVMINACVGFFYQADDMDEPAPLTYKGEPITGFNQLLAEALRLKVDPTHPARSIVIALFSDNDIALGTHNMKLGRWMSDTSFDVNQEFLGNL